MRILFVCTGNTCRSAMCDGWLRYIVRQSGRTGISCSSAGIAAGKAGANPNAVAVLKKYGADLSGHRARQMTPALAEEADLILCMTSDHRDAVKALLPEPKRGKVHLLMEYNGHPEENVPDPFGGTEDVYERCFRRMRPSLEKLLETYTH